MHIEGHHQDPGLHAEGGSRHEPQVFEKNSNRLFRRYVQNSLSMNIAGKVEVFADIAGIAPHQWDLFVRVSVLAIEKEKFKTVKMSVGHMDDDPSGMVESAAYGIDTVGAVADQAQSTTGGAWQ